MSNSDLTELLNEVNFSTPERAMEERDATRENVISKLASDIDSEKLTKRVLISDNSLTRPDSYQPFEQHENESIPLSKYEVITDGANISGKEGTSPSISSEDKKKYKLLCVDVPDDFCRTVMGQRSCFCMNKQCVTKHKNADKVTIYENNLYPIKSVEKTRSTAFLEPTISISGLDEDIVESWSRSLKTLEQWTSIFRLTKMAKDIPGIPTAQAIIQEKKSERQAKEYKTPKKEKFKDMIDTSLPEVYASFTPATGSFSSEDDARNFMIHIEQTFKNLNKEILKLNKNQVVMHDLLENGLSNLDIRVTDLEDDLGEKPVHLEREYDAPNVWGSVSALASMISNLNEGKDTTMNEKSVRSILDLSVKELATKNELEYDAIKLNVEFVKNTLVNVARSLKEQISTNVQNIAYLEKSTSSRSNILSSDNALDDLSTDFKELQVQVETLDAKMNNIDNKGDVIKFHGLNFLSKDEASAWLEHHVPSGNFGLLVDFHTLMEHIHHSITGVDSLKQLQNVYKLKMKTLSEALSVASFEIPMPRFFTCSGVHVVIDNQESYFSQIKTYKQWNNPNSGYKLRLKRELERFRRSHLSTIRESLSVRNPLYQLATSTLTESISWANGLINYIDLTYEEYSSGKFGSAKSWHVTTKLATALIKEVNKPREGALNSFEAGNSLSISKVIFYAVLQSLDAMTTIAAMDYRDSPVVSTELVKFLSLNTDIDSVDKLEEQSAEHATNLKQLNKDTNTARTAINSVGNKTDELKKVVENIKKRVDKLEHK